MPTQENGQAALVARPTFVGVLSTSATDPIVVTSSSPHLLTTGDTVWINGANDVGANGVFPVVVLTSTTFELVGSTNDGGGGSAGLIFSLGFDSTFQIPSDGDPRDAASVDIGLEALADRTAWLASKVGAFVYPHYDQFLYNDDDTGSNWSVNAALGASYALVANSPQMPFYVATNDLIEIDFVTTATYGTPQPDGALALGYQINGGTVTKIPGASTSLNLYALNEIRPVTLTGRILAPSDGLMMLGVIAIKGTNPTSLNLRGAYTFAARQWRQV